MITGLLALGVAQVKSRRTQEVIGYVYTESNDVGQLQRWLLYRNPENDFELGPPPDHMVGWTLREWQANVPSLWRGRSYYVWAQNKLYLYGGTYDGITWTRIPPASRLPKPTYPEVGDGPLQLDPTGGKLLDVVDPARGAHGIAFCVGGLAQESSDEYWMLPAQFQPAGKSARVAISVGQQDAKDLEQFVQVANRSWGPGGAFVITGCINHEGTAAPAFP